MTVVVTFFVVIFRKSEKSEVKNRSRNWKLETETSFGRLNVYLRYYGNMYYTSMSTYVPMYVLVLCDLRFTYGLVCSVDTLQITTTNTMPNYTFLPYLILSLINESSLGFPSQMGNAMMKKALSSSPSYSPQPPGGSKLRFHKTTTTNTSNKMSQLYSEKKTKGVYSRPSAAIERGSGFYIPGLEGSRVRLLFGGTVLLLTYINHTLGMGDSNTSAVEFSQQISIFFGILLLLQGSIELAKENGLGISENANGPRNRGQNNASSKAFAQFISERLQADANISDSIAWSVASFVALTPTTHVLLIEEKDGMCEAIYSLGDFDSRTVNDQDMKSALDAVYNSKGGRVAINESHPAASLVPEVYRRSIILQKVETPGSKRCLVVASNQLLASYTKNDLKWLGSLAQYIKS